MNSPQRSLPWVVVQLDLGLVWVALLASRAANDGSPGLTPPPVGEMVLLAGWLPSVPLALCQQKRRRWRDLLASDLLGAGLLVLLACTAYLPLFFFHVVWFLPLALLPRGVLAELMVRGRNSLF